MHRSRIPLPLLAAVAAGLLPAFAAAPARAADILPPLPALDGPVAAAPVGAGWYLRGDIGYAAYRDPEATARAGGASVPLVGEALDAAPVAGLGAGYRFNSWLRADLTVDHRFANEATLFAGVPNGGARGVADLSSTTALANAYLDLGTWHGFTPYVGAGLGYAWNRFADYTVSGCTAPCAIGGVGLASGALTPEATKGGFAWALMAGVAVDLGRSLSLDLGYRYVALGEAALTTTGGTLIETGSLDAHEARVGVRWRFGDGGSARPISRSF
ncbi:MAG: outer membrane protein [Salinarimonas sp.]